MTALLHSHRRVDLKRCHQYLDVLREPVNNDNDDHNNNNDDDNRVELGLGLGLPARRIVRFRRLVISRQSDSNSVVISH